MFLVNLGIEKLQNLYEKFGILHSDIHLAMETQKPSRWSQAHKTLTYLHSNYAISMLTLWCNYCASTSVSCVLDSAWQEEFVINWWVSYTIGVTKNWRNDDNMSACAMWKKQILKVEFDVDELTTGNYSTATPIHVTALVTCIVSC